VELIKLKPDTRTMKDLELLRSHNPSIVYCKIWRHRRR